MLTLDPDYYVVDPFYLTNIQGTPWRLQFHCSWGKSTKNFFLGGGYRYQFWCKIKTPQYRYILSKANFNAASGRSATPPPPICRMPRFPEEQAEPPPKFCMGVKRKGPLKDFSYRAQVYQCLNSSKFQQCCITTGPNLFPFSTSLWYFSKCNIFVN